VLVAHIHTETLLYFDTTNYDPFWEVVQELDVPVYFHPAPPTAVQRTLNYEHAPWIIGPSHQYAVQLSNHVIGLAANGVLEYASILPLPGCFTANITF
jgi:2,3-dihydroxybenzoate decarboxylase